MEYRYSLQRKSKQIICPACGQKKFTPYIDNATGIPLQPEICGRCSREIKCQYHYPPRQLFEEYPEYRPENDQVIWYEKEEIKVPVSFIDNHYVEFYRKRQKENLTHYLKQRFGGKKLNETLDLYKVGYRNNQVIFWQIDVYGNVRTGKQMKYGFDGKRKSVFFVHNELGSEDFELEQCYFGEHLLSQFPDKDVMIVESEKTCLVASMYIPEVIWLGTGGLRNSIDESWMHLEGRKITLVPDEDAYDEWKSWQDDMQMLHLDVEINDICHGMAKGSDIADLIIQEL